MRIEEQCAYVFPALDGRYGGIRWAQQAQARRIGDMRCGSLLSLLVALATSQTGRETA
jgi:hypothetical protein